jgi:hypothetical protein
MSWAKPAFIDSEYFYYDEKGIPALRGGAPKELVDELNEFLEYHYGNDTGEK